MPHLPDRPPFLILQSPELVDYLVSQGADVNAEDVQRKTALHYAVQAPGPTHPPTLINGQGHEIFHVFTKKCIMALGLFISASERFIYLRISAEKFAKI